jgi:hypothetical protein
MFDKAMELDNKTALDLQSSLQKGDLKKLITQKSNYHMVTNLVAHGVYSHK